MRDSQDFNLLRDDRKKMVEIIGREMLLFSSGSVHALKSPQTLYVQQKQQQKPTQMPRQTIPLGTFTSATTAPVAPLHCPSHPLRCSYSFLWRGRGWFIWGKGLECPWLCPHLPHPPSPLRSLFSPPSSSPMGQVTALHCEGPREP